MNKYVFQTLRYATMPGIVPWLKGLGFNFGYLAYLMALIFKSVRLLPVHHPYLLVQNMGKFSIRQVLAAAAHNLHGGVRNIDQYLIFFGFLIGVVLLIAQFGLLFAAIAVHAANAAPLAEACPSGTGFCFSMFNTTHPGTDVAYILLDYVFQIPGMFNSMVMFDQGTGAPVPYSDISPMAKGMHFLFAFYSKGMLIIAVLIICYYIFVVLVETAQTGVPFGARFDSIYVPIRLVIALTLLVPVYYGLNSGQWITLKIAKMGSSLATNAWLVHNNKAGDNPMGLTMREMVVAPKTGDITSVVTFLELASACRYSYYLQYNKVVEPYVVRPAAFGAPSDSQPFDGSSDFTNTLNFTGNGSINITIGEKDTAKYKKYNGFVKPYCGTLTIDVDSVNLDGIRDVYETYFDLVKTIWSDADVVGYGLRTAIIKYQAKGGDACAVSTTSPWGAPCAGALPNCECKDAGYSFHVDVKQKFQVLFDTQMTATINIIRATTNDYMKMTPAMRDLGWGGAGVWFTRLGDYNGALVTAAIKVPVPTAMPAVMEAVQKIKRKTEPNTKATDRYSPTIREGKTDRAAKGIDEYWKNSDLDDQATDIEMAKFLDKIYRQLNGTDMSQDIETKKVANPVMNAINDIYGISGLYELRKNTDVVPMSRLAALGRGIIERSITFVGGALIMAGVGGLMGAADSNISQGFNTISGTLSMVGMSGLTVGFVFYYIIPLMPFMYFFFAVSRWVKSIFEAMVGIPLWALAHLKIDGEGIPGQAAANGYYLLLEIMIRPVLTVFGLLAGMSIFNASVAVLDSTFDLVVRNVGGYDPYPVAGSGAYSATPKTFEFVEVARGALDEFMYTIVYVIILYMIGTSCFKLVDLIPNGVLRFIGAGVSSFGDKTPDPLDSMVQYTALAGNQFAGQLAKGATSLGQGAGDVLGGMMGQGGIGRASGVANKAQQTMDALKARMAGPSGP